ncbi:hypothetical protein TNCV_3061021 [Trichonephila clavipes]|nr:hypothetical protein TNCV_3061021 [Trichonephila clavipes]
MERNYRRFVLLGKFLSLGSGSEGKKRNRFEQTSELYRGKYRCVQPKINLCQKDVLMPVKQCFSCGTFRMSKRLPSHDGETV